MDFQFGMIESQRGSSNSLNLIRLSLSLCLYPLYKHGRMVSNGVSYKQ